MHLRHKPLVLHVNRARHPNVHGVALEDRRAALRKAGHRQPIPQLVAILHGVQLGLRQIVSPEVLNLRCLLDVQQLVHPLAEVIARQPRVEARRSIERVNLLLQLVRDRIQRQLALRVPLHVVGRVHVARSRPRACREGWDDQPRLAIPYRRALLAARLHLELLEPFIRHIDAYRMHQRADRLVEL